MTEDDYRSLALALPEAVESAHMSHPDFRGGGKIFATLWPKERRGVVMLTPEQQEILTGAHPGFFSPVNGAWGRRGSTWVTLDGIDEDLMGSALLMAWRNKAPRKLVAQYAERIETSNPLSPAGRGMG